MSGTARSTFYYHKKRLNGPSKYAEEEKAIKKIFDDNKGRYGYRRITLEINRLGFAINHKTVLSLMKRLGIKCMVRPKKYRSYKGDAGKAAPDLLCRNFAAPKPAEKWVTDVTEFSLFGTKYYLSPVMDLYNREIISYCVTARPTLDLVIDMVNSALAKTPVVSGLILHSDQGWQYLHNTYQEKLKLNGIKQSMSRKGNCLDNSVMESFFGVLKTELFYLQKFDSEKHFLDELESYIYYYNNERIKVGLNGVSPVKYRMQANLK